MGSCLSDSLWRVARGFARGFARGHKDPLGGTGFGEDAGIGQECAHGLLGGFLSPLYNKRCDEYGGDINGRLRLTGLGGMNPNNGEAENVRVYTREGKIYEGTLQLCNASVHVNGDYSNAKRNWDTTEVVLDEDVSSAADDDIGAGGDYNTGDISYGITDEYSVAPLADDISAATSAIMFFAIYNRGGL